MLRSLLFLSACLAVVLSKQRTQSPVIHPAERAFLDHARVSFSCATPGATVYYTVDITDPTLSSPSVELNGSSFTLNIDTAGSYTVKAFAVADDMIPSDIVLKRLEVFHMMEAPDIVPSTQGRYNTPLNVSVVDPSVCSISYLEIEFCVSVITNKLSRPVQCISCKDHIFLDDIGTYTVSAYYSIDDLTVSKTVTRTFSLTRPPFDTKKLYINHKIPFQFKPKVDVFTVSKDLPAPRYGCSKRNVRGHHIILHNPLGHFDILPPSGGCGAGLALPSDSSKDFSVLFSKNEASRRFFRNPTYKNLVQKLSNEDIATWRTQHDFAVSQGATSCTVATNAGFFDINDFKCLGNLISQGEIIQLSPNHNVNFGIKNGSYIIGYVDIGQKDDKKSSLMEPEFDTLISGLVWLVRGSKPYAQESVAPIEGTGKIGDGEDMSIQSNGPDFVNILSARTAIGYDSFGRLMMAQVEGESFVRGMNLLEFADFLVELGFESAINLDGGGSATITAFDTLVSEPSWKCTEEDNEAAHQVQDDDIVTSLASGSFRVCEKQVSSITCVHPMQPPDDDLLLPSQIWHSPSSPPSAPPSIGLSTPHPSSKSLIPVEEPAVPDVETPSEPYGDTDMLNIEKQLHIYEYCTYSFAILLVISLTANCWWAISYNTLKKTQQRVAPSALASGNRSHTRGIELLSRTDRVTETKNGNIRRNYEETDYELDNFEANVAVDESDSDSCDDEAALMSPPSRKGGLKHGLKIGAGLNPFQRR